MSQQQYIPRLRFPEFSGVWEEFKLGELTKWKSGGTPSKEVQNYWNGTIPWISASSMYGNRFSDSDLKITEVARNEGFKTVRKGTILLLVRGSMLFNKIPVGIAETDVTFNQDVKAIEVNENLYNEYLLQWFLSHESKLLNLVLGTGIGAGKLDTGDLLALKLQKPTLPEQQKIAAFLTAVDTKIEQLTKKKTLLEQYKKGVMQKLFSQEIRFKPARPSGGDGNGHDYPDWEEKKLGEVVERISSGKTKPEIEGGYDVFGSTGIIGKCDKYSHDGSFLLIARVGANAGTINRVSGKFGVTDNTLVIEAKQGFSIDYLKAILIQFNLNKLIFGSGQPLITAGQLKSLKILLPCLAEQIQIAHFLSALDDKTALVSTQLEKTQKFKKGLLQQMFV